MEYLLTRVISHDVGYQHYEQSLNTNPTRIRKGAQVLFYRPFPHTPFPPLLPPPCPPPPSTFPSPPRTIFHRACRACHPPQSQTRPCFLWLLSLFFLLSPVARPVYHSSSARRAEAAGGIHRYATTTVLRMTPDFIISVHLALSVWLVVSVSAHLIMLYSCLPF